MGQGGVIVPMRNKKNVVPEAVAGTGKIQSQPGVDQIIYPAAFRTPLSSIFTMWAGLHQSPIPAGGDLSVVKGERGLRYLPKRKISLSLSL